MSRPDDNEHMAKTMCAFDRIFGVDPPPASGLQRAEIQAGYGSCESTARGSEESADAAGSFTLSNGQVVRYRVREQLAGMFVATDEDSTEPYAGWGRTRKEAIQDLRDIKEGYPL